MDKNAIKAIIEIFEDENINKNEHDKRHLKDFMPDNVKVEHTIEYKCECVFCDQGEIRLYRNYFFCATCGVKGNAIVFMMTYYQISMDEAINKIIDKYIKN